MRDSTERKNNIEVSWQAPEHIEHDRDIRWYISVGVVALIIFFISLLLGNFLFAIFIALAGVLMVTLSHKKPEIYTFKINKDGVYIGDDIFHDYENIEGFGIIEHEHKLDEIIIKKDRILVPFIKLPIDSRTLPQAKRVLKKKLKEEEYRESVIDTLADVLKI